MKITLVAAVSCNGVIGRDGELPWRLPDDLRHFKATTMGHHVLVGRKTWDSIGRALPGRTWIVLTRDPSLSVEGAQVVTSVDEALQLARAAGDDELCVAGGGELYRLTLPLAERIWLTRVDTQVEGDATFPDPDRLGDSVWVEVERTEHPADDRHAHAFAICRLERAHRAH